MKRSVKVEEHGAGHPGSSQRLNSVFRPKGIFQHSTPNADKISLALLQYALSACRSAHAAGYDRCV